MEKRQSDTKQQPLPRRSPRKRTKKRVGEHSSSREQLEEIGQEGRQEVSQSHHSLQKQPEEEGRLKGSRKKPRTVSPHARSQERRENEKERQALETQRVTVARQLAKVEIHLGVWQERVAENPTVGNMKGVRDAKEEKVTLEGKLAQLEEELREWEESHMEAEEEGAGQAEEMAEGILDEEQILAECTGTERMPQPTPMEGDLEPPPPPPPPLPPTKAPESGGGGGGEESGPSVIPDTSSRPTPQEETPEGVETPNLTTCPETPLSTEGETGTGEECHLAQRNQ